ncbi:MAG: isoprenylcysteine carboxylmethyltransferase family protein [Bryobacterales bacterium]|nr:isoprenylcysteine carboxylmethyltransferase family protein [Bryobacterales bacterium]
MGLGLVHFSLSVVALFWVAFVVVFSVNHARVRRRRGVEDASARRNDLRAPVSMLGLLLEGVAIGILFVFRRPLEAVSGVEAAAAMVIAPASVLLSWYALRHLGQQWRVKAVVTEGHELVTTGPYRLVRHPIFLSLFGMALATALLITQWAAIVAAVLVYIVGTEIRIRAEDRILLERFGEKFRRYQHAVPAYLPFLR